MRPFLRRLAYFMLLVSCALQKMAYADENLLGYTMGAETLPKGAKEVYLWYTQKEGKRNGQYQREEYRAEFEYGIANDLSGAVYVNGLSHNYHCGLGCAGSQAQGYEISGSRRKSDFSGISFELKKNLMSPYKDDFGLALYGEVTYTTRDRVTGHQGMGWEYETKVIFQKPFLDGQLQWLTNFELELESWKETAGEGTEWAVAPRLRTGVSYRFAPKWSLGVEGWVDKEYLKSANQTKWVYDHWDAFFGPSVHYGDRQWWFTASVVQQLAGSNEANNNRRGLHLADHEKKEFRLKLGYNF